MASHLRSNKDFLAGLLFILIGCAAVAVARGYPFGTTMRMGSGYFPTVLGAILILLGACVLVRGLRNAMQVEGAWGWKPLLFIVLSIVLFGLLMPRFGLIPALVALVFVSAFAGREFRFMEVLVLAIVVSALAVVLLLYVLKMPYPLIGELRWIS
ncbi:MAG: tripartite tricarboxylate transporter TctB family protein [Burkholderiales bacterium]